MNAFNHVSTSS